MHALHLRSELATGCRGEGWPTCHRLLEGARIDVVPALGPAGLVDVAMLVGATRLFHAHYPASRRSPAPIEIGRLLGGGAALVVVLPLLTAGAR